MRVDIVGCYYLLWVYIFLCYKQLPHTFLHLRELLSDINNFHMSTIIAETDFFVFALKVLYCFGEKKLFS